MSRTALIVCSAVVASGLWPQPLSPRLLAAEPAKLAVATADPPKEIAEPIRAALDNKSLRLSTGETPFFEFWFRKELPLANKPEDGQFGLNTIEEGTVLGAVKVNAQRTDFRGEEIPPGVYVLRCGIQPEDGNHLGVSPTRTFALMLHANRDTKLDLVTHDDLVKSSTTINAAKHPSNLNLQPVEKAEGEFPRLDERNDGAHKVVLLKLPARIKGDAQPMSLVLALVYEGVGQH